MQSSIAGSYVHNGMTDQGIQSLFRAIDQNQKIIEATNNEKTVFALKIQQLQIENKSLKKKNDELRQTNGQLVNIYNECLNNLGAQISEDSNQKNLVDKTLLSLDIQKMKIIMQQKQYIFQKRLLEQRQITHEKDLVMQKYAYIQFRQKEALRIQIKSYNYLIADKTQKIENMTNYFMELHSILKIQSKEIDFPIIKGKVAEVFTANYRLEQSLQQKEMKVEKLIEAIKIMNHP